MKSPKFFNILVLAAAMTSGCEDSTVFTETSQVRAYETDAEIMAQFVEVDDTTGKFIINLDKKIMVSDYVLTRNREELMAVSVRSPQHIHL